MGEPARRLTGASGETWPPSVPGFSGSPTGVGALRERSAVGPSGLRESRMLCAPMCPLLALLGPLALAFGQGGRAAPAPRPNVVLILADDLGYGDLGCYGQKKIQTPNLDRLASEGLRFTSFYAGGAVCVPSRAVLLTGKHTGHAALRVNVTQPLPDEELTLAEHLHAAGYRTVAIGKWALGNSVRKGSPLEQGFDAYFGYIDQILAHRYYPSFLLRDDKR